MKQYWVFSYLSREWSSELVGVIGILLYLLLEAGYQPLEISNPLLLLLDRILNFPIQISQPFRIFTKLVTEML